MNRRLAIALLACAPLGAAAENLTQVYQDARGYDAQFGAARYALQAGLERVPQGRALLLPSLNLTANTTRSNTESDSKNPAVQPSFERDINSYGYALTFTQPLYRRQNSIQFDQAEFQAKQAEAQFGLAGQDLILRTAQAYFDVLAAQDTLALVRAQKTAIAEQLAQAKRNFEVGTATITDTHEAQARFDLAAAQEISALNDVDARGRALQQLAGKEYPALKPLRPDVKLAPPNPDNMQSWVELAEKQAYPVLVQEAASEIAALEAKRTKAGHAPTLDFVASHGYTSQNASQLSTAGSEITTNSISLQFALPLYQGGAISSREREAAFIMERTRQELENARRGAALATRQAYLAVINGIAQVSALQQALVSSQSALESNRLGYEVGVRINIDVLNAQQQVFSTRRDLAVARYNTITNFLRLKAAAGGLREEDLEEVNRALAP
jgi:outer membrane protein